MFVLKYKFECPELMIENFYDEVVSVRDGIALVNNAHVKNSLLLSYDFIGEIKEEKELNDLLDTFKESQINLNVSRIEVDLDELSEIFAKKKPLKEEVKPLFERIGE